MKLKYLYLLCAAPLFFAACAHMSPPATTARASPGECARLTASLTDARARQAAAEQRANEAWKAVVPVAVVAIYAQNASEGAEAEREADNLQNQRAAMGCATT